jgi:hypothetical protein
MLDARRMEVYSYFNANLGNKRNSQVEVMSIHLKKLKKNLVGDCAEKCKSVLKENFNF